MIAELIYEDVVIVEKYDDYTNYLKKYPEVYEWSKSNFLVVTVADLHQNTYPIKLVLRIHKYIHGKNEVSYDACYKLFEDELKEGRIQLNKL